MEVDADQIRHLEKVAGRRLAGPVRVVDVESAASPALAFELILYPALNASTTAPCEQWTAVLPVHMRYHAPNALGSAAVVRWRAPLVCSPCLTSSGGALASSGGALVNEIDTRCAKASGNTQTRGAQMADDGLETLVPVGSEADLALVQAVTLAVVLGGTLVVALAA